MPVFLRYFAKDNRIWGFSVKSVKRRFLGGKMPESGQFCPKIKKKNTKKQEMDGQEGLVRPFFLKIGSMSNIIRMFGILMRW